MKKSTGPYPVMVVEGGGRGVVSHAGGSLLTHAARVTGLDAALSQALAPWRLSGAVHDPGKILLDLAVALALGGDCLADIGLLRAEPGVFGPVASDPTVSRLIAVLAGDAPQALAALRVAHAAVRSRALPPTAGWRVGSAVLVGITEPSKVSPSGLWTRRALSAGVVTQC